MLMSLSLKLSRNEVALIINGWTNHNLEGYRSSSMALKAAYSHTMVNGSDAIYKSPSGW